MKYSCKTGFLGRSLLPPFVFIVGMMILSSCASTTVPTALPDSEQAFAHAQQCQSGRSVGFLRTLHGELVDASSGCQVQLTGVNWFGFETSTFAPHGLWARNLQDMLKQIVHTGFNTIRLPFTNQLFDPTSKPNGINYQLNPDLKGLRGLALMDRVVQGARNVGLKIILDRHDPTADLRPPLWYTNQMPQTRWIQDWVMLAQHYRGNDTIIGADLDNEPHGAATWGDGNLSTDWRLAAEQAGNAILAVSPDWLIIVEGIEQYHNDWYWWGGNLEGAAQYPVRLSVPDKLVYSAHDYGPELFKQSWLKASNFPNNLPGVWQKHWAYLQKVGTAPVFVGEFGGGSMGQDAEGLWQRSLVTFLKTNNISYAYWSWNPDSGDTGGILQNDWKTVNQSKLDVLNAYQWPMLGRSQTSTNNQSGSTGAILDAYR
jgi:endoglucanase